MTTFKMRNNSKVYTHLSHCYHWHPGRVLPILGHGGQVGRFRGDSPVFEILDLIGPYFLPQHVVTIWLIPTFCRKTQFISITFSPRESLLALLDSLGYTATEKLVKCVLPDIGSQEVHPHDIGSQEVHPADIGSRRSAPPCPWYRESRSVPPQYRESRSAPPWYGSQVHPHDIVGTPRTETVQFH